MKTLIFPSEFPTNKGGAVQSTLSMLKGVAVQGNFEIVLVCPKDAELSHTLFPDNVHVVTTRISCWVMNKNRILQTLRTIFDVYCSVFKYLGRDTWFVTNQPVISSIIGLMPIWHCREIYINRGGDFNGCSMASRIIRNKINRNRINYAVGISQKQVKMLVDCGIPKDRVFLVHNGLPMPTKQYCYSPLDPKLLKISTMGFITDLKNQMEGVRLVKLCRNNGINAILNIYGTAYDDSDYKKQLSNLIKELDVMDYVNYCGFVSGENLYKDTDIIISFSRAEGFGRSLVEGMLRFKPIIAWRGAGGPADITADGRYGYLVNSNDAIDYYTMIRHLLDNPTSCERNVRDAYVYACQNFTEELMVDKYVDLFNNLCK